MTWNIHSEPATFMMLASMAYSSMAAITELASGFWDAPACGLRPPMASSMSPAAR